MTTKITVEIDMDERLTEESRYAGVIDNENYKMVVTGKSIADCFRKLSESMVVVDDFRKNRDSI